MKRLTILFSYVLVLGLIIFSSQSCSYDECKETRKYIYYRRVIKTVDEIRKIKFESPAPLENPGKIYVYGDYLFVNEIKKGIHVFDNSDVSNPVNLAFIRIWGNVDLAVKDNILYADNFFDLLSIDISDPKNPKEVGAVQNVFRKAGASTQKIVVGYIPTDTSVVIDCSSPYWGYPYYLEKGGAYVDNTSVRGGNVWNPPPAPDGVGGSMARFTLSKNRLYTVENRKLTVFDVTYPQFPSLKNTVHIDWRIETIFPYKDNLFLGSTTGMHIFSIKDPDSPSFLYKFEHARSCDPVFVVGDYAYVTLRSGNACNGFTNQLDVLDIKNLSSPRLIKSYPMSNPHGLSVIDDKMILCEGDFGYKVLDIKNKKNIKVKSSSDSGHFYDAIAISENDIILVGKNGLYQYKLDGFNLVELSHIPIVIEAN